MSVIHAHVTHVHTYTYMAVTKSLNGMSFSPDMLRL
jgi:hypothetical protein